MAKNLFSRFYLMSLILTLTFEPAFADPSALESVNLLKQAIEQLKNTSLENMADPYAGQPNLFHPEGSAIKTLEALDGIQIHKIVLNSYNLPPSVMVPKVWLALKMQTFYKEPIRLLNYVMTPKGFDPHGTKKYPVAVLSHGSGGHIGVQLWYALHLAKRGYIAVIPEHFLSPGRECCPTDLKTFRIEANAMDLVRVSEFLATQKYVEKKNIFLLGWSLGGMSAEMAARASFTNAIAPHMSYNAAVCFYPQIVVQELAPLHKSKILFIAAEKDDYTPMRNITNYVARIHQFTEQKDRVKMIVAKDSYHNFDRISSGSFIDYGLRVFYQWARYEGFGHGVINYLGCTLGDWIFGKYAYHNLQTLKNAQIVIDTQNPLRGFVPLNELQVNSTKSDVEQMFQSWETFQSYFMSHVKTGAQLIPNPKAAAWALEALFGYLQQNRLADVATESVASPQMKVD